MINHIIEELRSDNSRLFKESVLEREKNNEMLKLVVFLALDPFTQFYIRKIPDYSIDALYEEREVELDLEQALLLLDDLSSRKYTGNNAANHLKYILSSVHPDDALVIERIIAKDLDCGVSTGTVNKIWPGLIHEYPCMLASKFDQKLLDKITYPALAECKSDGMRFNAIVKNGSVEYRSRNGKELFLLGSLDKQFLALSQHEETVWDGELRVLESKDGTKLLSRKEGNGILNKANKGTISQEEADRVVAVLWDMIPLENFKKEYWGVPAVSRLWLIEHRMDVHVPERVLLIDNKLVDNKEQAWEFYREMRSRGEEGMILKDASSHWENKRSKGHIKFKAILEADLRIKGIKPGTGKYAGMLGAIECETEDGILQVNVGSGFNDEQRKTLGEEIIGKVVSIEYNEKIQNASGEWSLFLPIFIEVREDKTVANTFSELE